MNWQAKDLPSARALSGKVNPFAVMRKARNLGASRAFSHPSGLPTGAFYDPNVPAATTRVIRIENDPLAIRRPSRRAAPMSKMSQGHGLCAISVCHPDLLGPGAIRFKRNPFPIGRELRSPLQLRRRGRIRRQRMAVCLPKIDIE